MNIHDRKRRILCLVICLAIGLHLVFLYSLHDLPLEFLGRSSLILDEKPSSAPFSELGEEEINRHLAHVFQDFSQHAISSNLISPQIPLAEATPPAMDLVALELPSFDESPASFELSAHDLPKDSLEAIADGLLGNIQVDLPELFQHDISLRVGSTDLGSIDGSSEEAHPLVKQGGEGSAGSIANSNDFNVALEYALRPGGNGYYFRLTLTPKTSVLFKTIAQNVVFLIDRSHSIDKERYAESKTAVFQVLQKLRPEDRFNILVFDDRVTSFASQMVPSTPHNYEIARQFLHNQPYGGMFASTDLYSSLGNIIPDIVEPTEVNAAILLSDGDTFLSKDKQRRSIASWTNHNEGKVALFCVTAGEGNNLPLLDFLAAENKGALTHTQTSVSDALSSLMKQIGRPIAKDIVVSAITRTPGTNLELFPPSNRQPHLYQNKPYVLYGTIDNPADFYLFLQGKYYDRWLDIRQLVSFRQGKQVSSAELEQALAVQQVYNLYEDYLRDGSIQSLSTARKILHQYKLPVAFQ